MHIAIGWFVFIVMMTASASFIAGSLLGGAAKYEAEQGYSDAERYYQGITQGAGRLEQKAQTELKDAEGKVVGTLRKF